jgi:hypothetical protein
MKRVMLVVGLLLPFSVSAALTREIHIPSSRGLPSTSIIIKGNKVTWQLVSSDEYVINYISIPNLSKNDAKKLLSISQKAKSTYQEIIDVGRCPNNTIKSELDHFYSMRFTVVCKNNNIMVHIWITDYDMIDSTYNIVEASDIEKLAKSVIKELEKQGK